jgi:hypothetical protein
MEAKNMLLNAKINPEKFNSSMAKPFTLDELKKALKQLNKNSAMGLDEIHNLYLINLPRSYLDIVL